MNNIDKEYFRLLNLILNEGRIKHNRTGIDTIGVFGEQAKYDIDMDAFPILTTKKVWFKGIVHELLWFIKGDTNIKYLVDNDVHIWDEWAYKRHVEMCQRTHRGLPTQDEFINHLKTHPESDFGELGEGTYGGMWRAFPYYYEQPEYEYGSPTGSVEEKAGTVDQLQKVIDKLKTNPDDRRMIISAWHPYWVDHCALPPCHCLFHFNTEELTLEERLDLCGDFEPKGFDDQTVSNQMDLHKIPTRRLNCLLYQRSNDTALGIPFNITSYALLTAMIAHCVNMIPGVFTHSMGDLHIYTNHIEGIKLQLTREPKKLPRLWLNPEIKSLFDFKFDDIKLEGYDPHPTIKFDVAV
jgi:thymidylate synthase